MANRQFQRAAALLAAHLALPAAFAAQPFSVTTAIYSLRNSPVGKAIISNTNTDLVIRIESALPWRLKSLQVYAGHAPLAPGKVNPARFPHREHFHDSMISAHTARIPLANLNAAPGKLLHMAIHTELVQLGGEGSNYASETDSGWAFGPTPFQAGQWGWTLTYTVCEELPGSH